MFGNTAATTSNTGFGGFGNIQQQNKPATGFGSFGAATTTAPTSLSFGASTNTNSNPSGGGFGGGFGGFGSTNTSTAPSTTATFGGGSSLFGSTNTSQPGITTTNTASPFSFSAANTTQPATSAASGLFGSANKPGTGFFGSSNTTTNTSTAPATSGFGFGNTNTSNTNTGSTSFGSGGSSLFGNTTANMTTTGSSLFGGNTGFGSSNKTTGFGTGAFGNTTGGLLGSNAFTNSNNLQQNTDLINQQRAQQVYQVLAQMDQDERARNRPSITSDEYKPEYVWHALALLKSWWDPASPHCRFRHYFYNVVTPQEVQLYQRPPDHDEAAWKEAQAANPDPARMVPALAIGFEDIEKRMEEQRKLSEAHKAKLQEVRNILKRITQKSQLETQAKLAEHKQKQMQIVQRTIGLMKYAQVLRNKGLSITADEELMRTKLENIQEQLNRSEQFHGKLSQLWAQLQLIKESGRKYGKIEGVDEWDTVSEENLKNITKILEEHDNGIKHLIHVIEDDTTFVDGRINSFKMNDKRYRYL